MAILRPSNVLLLLLMGLAFIALVGMAAPLIQQAFGEITLEQGVQAPPFSRERLIDAPLTKHALAAHPEREMDAEAIRQAMVSGRCHPIEMWICSLTQTIILTCPASESANPNLRLGLFIGERTGEIITGFPNERWGSKVFGCSGPILLP